MAVTTGLVSLLRAGRSQVGLSVQGSNLGWGHSEMCYIAPMRRWAGVGLLGFVLVLVGWIAAFAAGDSAATGVIYVSAGVGFTGVALILLALVGAAVRLIRS